MLLYVNRDMSRIVQLLYIGQNDDGQQQIRIAQMLDWQGLLKFSLKYSDGTQKSEFKEMSAQDKKFLQEVMEQYCNTEIRRLQQLIKQLNQLKFDQEVDAIDTLQQMQQLLDSLDKGEALYKLGGHIALLRIIFYSKINSNKNVALQILSAANQNDAGVQNQSINSGALELTELIQKEQDGKVRENMMGAISAIIRGENLQAKRIFIKLGGLNLLKMLLCQNPTPRMTTKINTLLRDLLYYDPYLHQSYKDLSSFSNTAGLKIQQEQAKSKDQGKGQGKGKGYHGLTYDINEEKMKENFKPENAQYKGEIGKWMGENGGIKEQYQMWVKQEDKQ